MNQMLANIARYSAHTNGCTVEQDLDSRIYTHPAFDSIIHRTPAYEGLRCTFGVHETPGLTRVFIHPDDVKAVNEALDALTAAAQ